MDPALQMKLLKVIEDKSVRRLGGLRPKSINARLVAATNCDLEASVAEGAFRQDLYYRIKVLTIEIPPLRERGEDILLLARHFLDTFARQYGRPRKGLTEAAEAALRAYAWPGNVRELAHVMERAAVLHAGTAIGAEELGIAPIKPPVPVAVTSDGGVQVDFAAGSIVLEDVERQLIARALEAAGWNRAAAAQLLGVSRDTLRYRLEKYRLHPPGE
jgi:DNA-binding NtrC family response regulator